MDALIPLVALTVLSFIFTFFYVNRASKQTRITLEDLGLQLNQGMEDINSQLEPILLTNKKAFSYFQSMGDDTTITKTLDRRIGRDMMGQHEDIIEGLRMVFPRVAEYIDERPEAVTKLLPRLNTLISDPDTRKRLNLDLSGTSSDVSRIWREE